MLTEIGKFLDNQTLDVRLTHNGRFMDQKVTPDVLSFISDCILNLTPNQQIAFTKDDVWNLKYFDDNAKVIFGKPQAAETTARNEYDKFTSQPLKTLAASGVLVEVKVGNRNIYSINKREYLEYIAQSPQTSMKFLCEYLRRTLQQSGVWDTVATYFSSSHSENDYQIVKECITNLLIHNTPINGVTEARRIFPKIFNPLAHEAGVPGSVSGRVSLGPFLQADLMYNDVNFRDKGKSKSLTRKQGFIAGAAKRLSKTAKVKYEMTKNMTAVQRRHSPLSEASGPESVGIATQVHHIFPKSTHPTLIAVRENLILLTATQHVSLAHPRNDTRRVDPEYQKFLILEKLKSVEDSFNRGDDFYSVKSFVAMLQSGLGITLSSGDDIAEVRKELKNQFGVTEGD